MEENIPSTNLERNLRNTQGIHGEKIKTSLSGHIRTKEKEKHTVFLDEVNFPYVNL
jgi:hypothetical protein